MDANKYLHENRAWNWKWPIRGAMWDTKLTEKERKRYPSQCYIGPSKSVRARRARNGRPCKKYD